MDDPREQLRKLMEADPAAHAADDVGSSTPSGVADDVDTSPADDVGDGVADDVAAGVESEGAQESQPGDAPDLDTGEKVSTDDGVRAQQPRKSRAQDRIKELIGHRNDAQRDKAHAERRAEEAEAKAKSLEARLAAIEAKLSNQHQGDDFLDSLFSDQPQTDAAPAWFQSALEPVVSKVSAIDQWREAQVSASLSRAIEADIADAVELYPELGYSPRITNQLRENFEVAKDRWMQTRQGDPPTVMAHAEGLVTELKAIWAMMPSNGSAAVAAPSQTSSIPPAPELVGSGSSDRIATRKPIDDRDSARDVLLEMLGGE